MTHSALTKELIGDTSAMRLILRIEPKRLSALIVGPESVDPTVIAHSEEIADESVRALENAIYDNPLLLGDFAAIDIIFADSDFFLLPRSAEPLLDELAEALLPDYCCQRTVMMEPLPGEAAVGFAPDSDRLNFLSRTFACARFHHSPAIVANRLIKLDFTVKKMNEYSTVKFNITGLADSLAVVQLLSSSDQPVAWAPVVNGTAAFAFVPPGTYYARLFADRNGNSIYDTGSIELSLQPEDTYYYPKKIPLKQNWDAVVNWDVNELPLDLQKPLDIKKNKPKPKPGEMPEPTDSDDEEEEDLRTNPGTLTNGSNRSSNRGGLNRGGSSGSQGRIMPPRR